MIRVTLRTGPFVTEIGTDIPFLHSELTRLYGSGNIVAPGRFADFHVEVQRAKGLRRHIRPQAVFDFDGFQPLKPLGLRQAVPLLEWGMNWIIGGEAHQYLILHAAVVERNGRALIMPAEPGSGKSTLTAALVYRGWRLLSDELTLIRPRDGLALPLARPINLKNESIDVIHRYAPGVFMSAAAYGTAKGTVALLSAPADSVARDNEPALPRWVVFPQFSAGAPARLEKRSKAGSLLYIGDNSINLHMHGAAGFELVADLVDRCDCLEFVYGDLDEAVRVFDSLAQTA